MAVFPSITLLFNLITPNNALCASTEFECSNGNCIYDNWECDDWDDCGDGSDEQNCYVDLCDSYEFTCSNGECVWDTYRCDGSNQCADGSDEEDCPAPPTAAPTVPTLCESIDYDSAYYGCTDQCALNFGYCTDTTHKSGSINGYTYDNCECCDCGEDTDTDTDTDNSDTDKTSNGCETEEAGAVENPLQQNSEVIYIFLAVFCFVCVIPLWLFAFKCRVKTEDGNQSDRIDKYFDIMDDNGRKRGFCQYLKWQHSILKLCCGTNKNRFLVWSSFGFDNVLVFSLSILFASISASYHSENCYYQNGGTTIQSSTTTSGDGGDFEYKFTDTLIIMGVSKLYGFFIGQIADYEFKQQKFHAICFVLIIFVSVLFLIVTIIIRSSVDMEWNMSSYFVVFTATQMTNVIEEIAQIYAKYVIGRCLVKQQRGIKDIIEIHKTAPVVTLQPVPLQTAVIQPVVVPQQLQIVTQPMPQQYIPSVQYVQTQPMPQQYVQAQPMPQQYVHPVPAVPQQTVAYYPQPMTPQHQPVSSAPPHNTYT